MKTCSSIRHDISRVAVRAWIVTFCLVTLLTVTTGSAEDWWRFRGDDGLGLGQGPIPLKWSETLNLRWKTKLPGSGSSSPIIVGDRVFLTCFSGEGDDLQRSVVAIDRKSGEMLWQKKIEAVQPEDRFNGYLTEHGYASNTPVSDGESLFVFLGKTGVLAFDLEGNELWRVSVGTSSSNRQWGSAASLILYKDMVIVNASEESRAIFALNKKTGEEVWKTEADLLELAYGTPILIEGDRPELVIAVPEEVWGLDPDTGKLRWYAETQLTGNVCPSVIAGDGHVFVFGGYRSSGSYAIKTGGKGNVTETHIAWFSRDSSYVATPLLFEGHLYWIDDRGLAYCIESETGKRVYRERVEDVQSGGRPFYASPICIDGNLIIPSRRSGVFVLAAQPEYRPLARNVFDDDSDFNASGAVSEGSLYLRSDQYLYCVGTP